MPTARFQEDRPADIVETSPSGPGTSATTSTSQAGSHALLRVGPTQDGFRRRISSGKPASTNAAAIATAQKAGRDTTAICSGALSYGT